MSGWQRPARIGIGIFTVLFGVAVFFAVRDRPTAGAAPDVERLDPEALFESTGAVVTQAKGGTRDFMVEAERQLTYTDGATRLEMVTITVEKRSGRDFVVRGRRAEIGETESQITLTGDVHLLASDGLEVTTDRASYDDRQGVLRVPGFLEFRRGRLVGTGVGAKYDRDTDRLDLLDETHVQLGAGAGGAVEVTSKTGSLARNAQHMSFRQDVRIDQDGQITRANRVMTYFDATGDRLEMVELRGDASVAGGAAAAGSLLGMRAHDINLTYGAPEGLLQQASLAGNAVMDLAGDGGQPGPRVSGDWIDAALGPDGATLTELLAREGVQLDFPEVADRPAQRIRAATMKSAGDPDRGLTTATFTGDVEYRERGQEAKSDRVTRASLLETDLTGGLGEIVEARFSGDVTFHDGVVEASATNARYDVMAGTIALLPGESASPLPRVVDARSSIEAPAIDFAVDGSGMAARGGVRSVLTPVKPNAGTQRTDGRMPGLLTSDEPAYVSSLALDYDGTLGRAIYIGDARLWQGETAVQSDRIELDERTGDLTAIGSARSTFLLEEIDLETLEPQSVPTIATAHAFYYEDALRRATYTTTTQTPATAVATPLTLSAASDPALTSIGAPQTGVPVGAVSTAAHVNGPYGDLTASKVELYLGAQDTLDRLEAYDMVKLLLLDRTATGARLTYFTDDGRYLMHGVPVQLLEDLTAECRETVGRTVTFYRSVDTITVDGNEEVRTQTKTAGQCPQLQFD